MSFVFGELLKGFRERAGLTQQGLADELGMSRTTVGAWERSLNLPDTREAVLQLGQILYLSEQEIDSLLYHAQFPLEFGTLGQGESTLVTSYGYLKVQGTVDDGKIYLLHKERHLLGRDPTKCDFVIHDDFLHVSRIHAAIYRHAGEVYVEDVSSAHGTFIDGRRVLSPRPLQPGQHLLLGGQSAASTVCILEFAERPLSTL